MDVPSPIVLSIISWSNFSVHLETRRRSLCPSIALPCWGIPWVFPGRDSNPCTQEIEPWGELRAAPKSSTLPTRPRRTAAGHACSGGVYTYTLGYTHANVRPLLHWTGVYPGYRVMPQQWAPKALSAQRCIEQKSSIWLRSSYSTNDLVQMFEAYFYSDLFINHTLLAHFF